MEQMTRRTFTRMAGGAAAALVQARGAEAVNIGGRREIFVDRELIAELRGAELRPAVPVDAGPALALDRPWEGPFSGYTTFLKDGDRFRIYYRGHPAALGDGSVTEVTCTAESPDAIRWTRPELELFPVQAARRNNVILAATPPFSHNFCPFLDTRPGVAPSERFKAVAGISKSGLAGFVSADGLRWTKRADLLFAAPKKFALDSQNLAFWSDAEQQYVLYYRTWKMIGGVNYRWTSRAVSRDFSVFTPAGEMDYGDAPPEHLYTNQTSAYFRAPHIYIGLCARFLPGRQVLSAEQAKAIRVDPKYFKDCSDAVLISSRGGLRYQRTFLDAFLRPGVGLENWVSRSNYPALNVLQTGRSTMSFLVNQNYGQPTAYLRRYELRLDGFASIHAGYRGGELITRPIVYDGDALELNYSTSAAGGVRLEVQDAAGAPLPGFALADSAELIGNEIDRAFPLRAAQSLAAHRGKPVRLRFALKDADLYGFRFA
jgi:hypothetical protein